MTNLLEETVSYLNELELPIGAIAFVTDGKIYMKWEEFANLAKDVSYDDGFGSQEINPSLMIVGNGWWLERCEYDGSEGWAFKEPPTRSEEKGVIELCRNNKTHKKFW